MMVKRLIKYASLVWWQNMKQVTALNRPSRVKKTWLPKNNGSHDNYIKHSRIEKSDLFSLTSHNNGKERVVQFRWGRIYWAAENRSTLKSRSMWENLQQACSMFTFNTNFTVNITTVKVVLWNDILIQSIPTT